MAKKARRKGAGGRRGGRKPGKWELVDPLEFRRWREQQRISRARLAAMLSVSATSIQNWEVGNVVPSHQHQERLAGLMKTPGVATIAQSIRPQADRGPDSGAVVEATGAIVTAYVKVAPKLEPDELLGVIRTVRQALAGA